jgi:hypothetical protein
LCRLIAGARDEKLRRILALVVPESEGMMALARHFRFQVRPSHDPAIVTAVLDLWIPSGRLAPRRRPNQ